MSRKTIYLAFLLIMGCIDPVNFKFKNQVEHLVVEAQFTDQPGFQYVRLSRSSPFTYPYNQYEEYATVFITSTEGEFFPFQYLSGGNYYPDSSATGTIGHHYTLHITTAEGKNYESQPVQMNPPVPIDTVYYQYAEVLTVLKGRKDRVLSPGYYILVNHKDPADHENYYRWSYKLQFEVHTHPENFIDYECCRFPVRRPKPCCSHCWVNETDENFAVADDRLTNGQEVVGQQALFIPYYGYLHFKCKITLYQHSIPEQEFLFYKNLNIQSQSNGGIFDPPPSSIKGNLLNIDNPEDPVLGYFDASGASEINLTILGVDFPGPIENFIWDDDCRTLDHSTTVPPPGW